MFMQYLPLSHLFKFTLLQMLLRFLVVSFRTEEKKKSLLHSIDLHCFSKIGQR